MQQSISINRQSSIINSESFVNNHLSLVNSRLRIIFFGTPQFVEPVLRVLKKNFDVIAEIRDPKQIITNQSSIINSADLFVVAAYGQILPAQLLEIPRLGSINIHPSLLPKYRGPSPIQAAILNGDKKTGVTFIKMDEKIDHGPIIYQFEEEISKDDTFETLAKRLFEKSADKIADVINDYQANQTTKPQDDSKASHTKLLTRQDGFIDLNSPPEKEVLERMIRAYHPWPSVWTKSSIINHKSLIIKFLPQQKLQVEGKKPMSYKDFINGYEKGQEFLKKIGLFSN